MKTASQELTLSCALSDPLIRTLMAADNVDPAKLESMLRQIAEELKPSLSSFPPQDLSNRQEKITSRLLAALSNKPAGYGTKQTPDSLGGVSKTV